MGEFHNNGLEAFHRGPLYARTALGGPPPVENTAWAVAIKREHPPRKLSMFDPEDRKFIKLCADNYVQFEVKLNGSPVPFCAMYDIDAGVVHAVRINEETQMPIPNPQKPDQVLVEIRKGHVEVDWK